MESALVSPVRRGFSSIGLQNLCEHTIVCFAVWNAYYESSVLDCNCELIGRAAATILGSVKGAKMLGTRGHGTLVCNQATG